MFYSHKMNVFCIYGFLFVCWCACVRGESPGLVWAPVLADPRRETSLECRYVTVSPPLHSVKWYYHTDEVFRYTPGHQPITFNATNSGITRGTCDAESCTIFVRLSQHRYNSRVSYTCEVSAEGPRFEVVKETVNITVAVGLDGGPVLEGVPRAVPPGGELVVNCTSRPAMPPPALHYYVDGQLQQDEGPTRTVPVGDLRVSWRSLRVPVTSLRGDIHVRCVAVQPVSPPLVKDSNATVLISRAPHLSMFISSGSPHRCTRSAGVVAVLSVLLADAVTRYSAFAHVV